MNLIKEVSLYYVNRFRRGKPARSSEKRDIMHRLIAFSIAAIALLSAGGVRAQAASPYPSRPIRIVVPFPPGGSPDVLARVLGAQLENQLGKNFIVDNRGGANGIIGAEIVAKAAPDGYTVMHTPPGFIINSIIYKNLQYDVYRDYVPVTNVASGSGYLLLVNPSLPAQSILELIALARTKPLSYGSPPAGNTLHLASELFNVRAGLRMQHVPYKGGADSFTALMANEIQVLVVPPTAAVPYVKAGRLRALGFTGSKRLAIMPEIPTVAESGLPDYVVDFTWNGWFAPAKTSSEIVVRLQREIHKALQAPKLREILDASGFVPVGNTPEEFRAFVHAEIKRYAEIVREAKIKVE
jgi:tripartite-type tricarboxylate transporter receptor subunit TctC